MTLEKLRRNHTTWSGHFHGIACRTRQQCQACWLAGLWTMVLLESNGSSMVCQEFHCNPLPKWVKLNDQKEFGNQRPQQQSTLAERLVNPWKCTQNGQVQPKQSHHNWPPACNRRSIPPPKWVKLNDQREFGNQRSQQQSTLAKLLGHPWKCTENCQVDDKQNYHNCLATCMQQPLQSSLQMGKVEWSKRIRQSTSTTTKPTGRTAWETLEVHWNCQVDLLVMQHWLILANKKCLVV